jgi:hypothetical protein
MRGAKGLWAATLLAALLALGCQSLRFAFYSGPFSDVEYRNAFNRWTDEGKIYDRLDTVIFVRATLKNQEFTTRYVDAYARAYQLSNEEKLNLARRLQKEARESYDFLLSAFTSVESENILDNPRSSYKIYLITPDGRRIKPVDVRRIKKVSEATRDFFPYINSWSRAYTVRFPGPPEEGAVLVVAGPLGKIELKYPSDGSGIFSQPPF